MLPLLYVLPLPYGLSPWTAWFVMAVFRGPGRQCGMTERRTPWDSGLLPGPDGVLSAAREARMRRRGEELAQDGALAVEETRAAMGELLLEIGRLSRLVALMDGDAGDDGEDNGPGADGDGQTPGAPLPDGRC
ncbi:hypothetical protein [Streptomyces monomycini]|uniref:hypothetical protein n=1 Tax=Streptomyces monomycini TaxID=371720 RepID=UPI0012FF5572|nr:hypothetical protein [Streptomyces monomycini]